MASSMSNGTTQDLISSNWAKGKQTFIIPLTFPDLTEAAGVLKRISYGGDVWEVRADLLKPEGSSQIPSKAYVLSQLEFLRQTADLPILFTIRTIPQGGKFPETAVNDALSLMLLAVDFGCEYIDVEFPWPASLRDAIKKGKKTSKLVASFHDWTGGIRWTESFLEENQKQNTYGDILKLSIMAADISDCHELSLLQHRHKDSPVPLLMVSMGAEGQLGRVTGLISLVTHALVPFPSAPGQLTLAQVNSARHLIGQLPRREFYTFGNNISHSLSPTIHNAAFAELGLPHHYSIHETPQMDETVKELMDRPSFGGASVTFPHKLNIQHMLDSVSEASKRIGAVNTVIVEEELTPSGQWRRLLKGDNTDWNGILKCIQDAKMCKLARGVVVGAGGAARAAVHAFQQLGVGRIAVVNRTKATADRLAADFAPLKIEIYQSLADAPTADVIVGCIPADDITKGDIPEHIFANGAGVVVEMSYRPPISALMQAAQHRAGWKVYDGVAVLREQAYAQFELWTGRPAPVLAILEALEKNKAAF